MRLFWLFLGLALLFIIPFLIWGQSMETAFSTENSVRWLQGYENWAWAAGVALLCLDFVLPVPGTAVMSALGYIYGPLTGGLLAGGGSIAAGLLAYGVSRWLGPGVARKLLGEKDFERGTRLFENAGGWIVALSRWLPLLPEVIACMAGLTRMPLGKFTLALVCGSTPLGFVFAYIGSTGTDNPTLAILLSVGVPPILWILAKHLVKKSSD